MLRVLGFIALVIILIIGYSFMKANETDDVGIKQVIVELGKDAKDVWRDVSEYNPDEESDTSE